MKDKKEGILSVFAAISIIVLLWLVIQQPLTNKTSGLFNNLIEQDHYIIKPPIKYLWKYQL